MHLSQEKCFVFIKEIIIVGDRNRVCPFLDFCINYALKLLNDSILSNISQLIKRLCFSSRRNIIHDEIGD